MRKIEIKPRALSAIEDVVDFIELINTPNGSDRWLDKVERFLELLASNTMKSFPKCKNENLAKLNYSCAVFGRKWVVVFRYTATTITIYRFVLGAKLK
jgi:hypothetical protein